MQYKQIVFTKPCVAEVLTYDLPQPEAEEVQVRLAISTISSGTERANLIGDPNISPKNKGQAAIFPRILGYSSAGIVERVGEKVTSVKPGDRVALMWSTHSQVQNIPESRVLKLEDPISFEDAALAHIATFPLAAIRKCRLEIGEPAMVVGMGLLGLVALPLLKNAGAAPIIAVDPSAEKREKALRSGADHALDPNSETFAEDVKALTNGGVKVAIEVTGVARALDSTLDCMAKFGRVALLGCTRHSDFAIDYYRKVHGPGITLVGAHTDARPQQDSYPGWWTAQDDIRAILKLLSLKRFCLAELIDEVHAVEEAPEVYGRLARESAFPLVQFDWRDKK